MTTQTVPGRPGQARAAIPQRTLRRDRWWVSPLISFIVLSAFVVYATWAAVVNQDYWADPYQSPFYSPCLTENCPAQIQWLAIPWWNFVAPALLVLIFPLGFRMSCYYYRKAYYRAFWMSPPACAVGEPHRRYTGERRFPLILQNSHRYWWYAAVAFAAILTYDAVHAFMFPAGAGIGVGTGVLLVNAVLIWGYTLGCHSCRHITAGRLNHFSKHPVRYRAWTFVSWLNRYHMQWAWASLVWIALADVYVRLVAAGWITDYHWIA